MKKFLSLLLALCLLLGGCKEEEKPAQPSAVDYSAYVWQAQQAGIDVDMNDAYPMDEKCFTPSQRYWVDLAKSLFIMDIEISEEISELQKANFFRYIISTPLYEDKLEEWKTGDEYVIPLKNIEEIIFSHLNTQKFNPEQGFSNQGTSRYDSNLQEYHTSMIGAYGGAAALGVLEYCEDDNTINIVLGVYEMNDFFNDPPAYILEGTYEVTFWIADNEQDFKVLRAHKD